MSVTLTEFWKANPNGSIRSEYLEEAKGQLLVKVSLILKVSLINSVGMFEGVSGLGQGGTIKVASDAAMEAALALLPCEEPEPAAEQGADNGEAERRHRLSRLNLYKEAYDKDTAPITSALGREINKTAGLFFRDAPLDDIEKVMQWMAANPAAIPTPPEELVEVPLQELSPVINMTGAEARKELAGRVITPEIVIAALADTQNSVIVDSLFIDGTFYPGTLNDMEAKIILRYLKSERTGNKQ